MWRWRNQCVAQILGSESKSLAHESSKEPATCRDCNWGKNGVDVTCRIQIKKGSYQHQNWKKTVRFYPPKWCHVSKVAKSDMISLLRDHLKALVNEDTLLRTHCCPWCLLGCANWETFVADTKCFWTKSETFVCPGHKVCVRNKCCARGQTGKHLCRQQCVRNNMSATMCPCLPGPLDTFFTPSL